MRLRAGLFALLAALLPVACVQPRPAVTAAVPPALDGDAEHPGRTHGWVDTKLYFGLGPADHPEQGISDTEWRSFLDREVTPRFPNGLSVVDVYGQWEGNGERQVERLRSKMLVIDYPDTRENRGKIEAIRAAWKQKTGDRSVMRVTEPANVSF